MSFTHSNNHSLYCMPNRLRYRMHFPVCSSVVAKFVELFSSRTLYLYWPRRNHDLWSNFLRHFSILKVDLKITNFDVHRYKTLDDCPRSTTTVLPPVSLTSTVDPPDTASSINLPPSPPEIGNGLYGPPCCKGPTHPENSTTTWPIITLTRTARPPSLPPTLIPPPCCKGTVTPKTSSTKVPSCTISSSAYTPTITPIPTPPKSCVTVTDTGTYLLHLLLPS